MKRSIGYPDAVLRRAGVWKGRGYRADQEDDRYLTKLAKYVPAEVLAIVLPIAGEVTTDLDRWLVAGLGLAATLIAVGRPDAQATWYELILATLAYAGWILGATNLGKLVGLQEETGRIIFAFVVFGVPLVDDRITAPLRASG